MKDDESITVLLHRKINQQTLRGNKTKWHLFCTTFPQLNANFDTMCFKVGVRFLFVKSPEIGVFLILFNYSPFYRAQKWSVESGFLFFIIKLLYDTSWGVCIFQRGVCIFGKGGVHLLIIHNDSSRKIAGAHLLRLDSFPTIRTVKDVIIPAQQPLLRWCQRTARQRQ